MKMYSTMWCLLQDEAKRAILIRVSCNIVQLQVVRFHYVED